MERGSFVFLIAGLGFFLFAFGLSAYLPMLPVADLKSQTIEELAAEPPLEFIELKEDYARDYRAAFYQTTDEQALAKLRDSYPEVFSAIFSRTDAQAIEFLQDRYPDAYAAAFGDASPTDALADFDWDREGTIEKIQQASSEAYANAFETTLESALATLDGAYSVTLMRIERENPQAYQEIFEERSTSDVFAEALRVGHEIYVGEACWHCHSQQVRPWGGDEERYGQVAYPEEFHNALNYPPMWGTRRIGPDLSRRGGKQSNDWHKAHFWNPKATSPYTVMPRYPWFFADDEGRQLNRKGLSMIAYVQWLGSNQNSQQETIHDLPSIERAFPAPEVPVPGQTGGDQASSDAEPEPVSEAEAEAMDAFDAAFE